MKSTTMYYRIRCDSFYHFFGSKDSPKRPAGRWCYCAPRHRQLLRSPSCKSTWAWLPGPVCGWRVVPPLELILKQSLISAGLHTIPRCDSEGWCAAWMGTRGGDTRIEMWSRWWPLWEDLSLTFLTGDEHWQFGRGPCMQFSTNGPVWFALC